LNVVRKSSRSRRKLRGESLESRRLLAAAPVAVDDLFEVREDLANDILAISGVLLNDSDADQDPLTAVLAAGPRHGELALRTDGGFTYTPRPDFWGVDSFTYRASDGVFQSNLALVTLLVLQANDPPTGIPDEYRVDTGGQLLVAAGAGTTANDLDPDDDTLTAQLVTGPAHGVLQLESHGGFQYQPDAGFHGVDTFTYRGSDGEFQTAPTTVRLIVNTLPALSADAFQIREDQSLQAAAPGLLANDSDVDGDSLTAELVARPAHGDAFVAANGRFIYTPHPNYFGDDSFSYRAFDGYNYTEPTLVTIGIASIPDPPIPSNDLFVTTTGGAVRTPFAQSASGVQSTLRALPLAANDLVFDASRNRIYASVPADGENDDRIVEVNPDNGEETDLAAVGDNPKRLALSDDGRFLYVAIDGANALSRIDLASRAIDMTLEFGEQFVEDIAVLPAAPRSFVVSLGNRNYSPAHQTTVVFDDDVRRPVEAEYSGGGSELAFGESSGVLYALNNQSSNFAVNWLEITADGVRQRSTAVPLSNAYNVRFEAVNDRVFLTNGGVYSTTTGTRIANFNFSGEVHLDAAADRAYYLTGDGANRTLRAYSISTLSPAGTLSLSQAAGPIAGLIRYGAHGMAFRAGSTLYLVDSTLTTKTGAYGVLANDLPVEATQVSAALTTTPEHGTAQMNPDGTFVYVPETGFVGLDQFTYELRSANFPPVPSVVTIEVKPANVPPHAQGEAFTVNEDQPLVLSAAELLANDGDPDGTAISLRLGARPFHGTLTVENGGGLRYVPDENYFGPDQFTYQVFDGSRYSTVATVDLQVASVNDAPLGGEDYYELDRGGALVADLAEDTGGQVVEVVELPFKAQLLAHDASRGRIYARIPSGAPDASNIIAIDDETFEIVQRVFVGETNSATAVSDDAEYLYYFLPYAERLRRLKLDTFQVDTAFEIVTNSVVAIDVMPGNADTIVVGQYSGCCNGQDGVQIYDHGVPRPLRTYDRVYSLSFDEAGTQVFVSSTFSDLSIYDAVPAGLTRQHHDRELGASSSFRFVDGLIYFNYGSVVDPYRMLRVGYYAGQTQNSALLPLPERNVAVGFATGTWDSRITAYDLDTFTEINSVVIPGLGDYSNGTANGMVAVGDGDFVISMYSGKVVRVRAALFPPAHAATPLWNDYDVEGTPLEIEVTAPPSHGVLELDAAGTFTYTPDLFFAGEDSFFYRALDGEDGSEPTKVTLVVRDRRLPPTSQAESYSTTEDSLLIVASASGVLTNDAGFNGTELTAQLAIQPRFGELTLAADGSLTYQPAPDWFGNDRFAYRAVDGSHDSMLTWVELTVTPVNDIPMVEDENYVVSAGETLIVGRADYAAAWDATEWLVQDGDRLVRYRTATGQYLGVFATLAGTEITAGVKLVFGPNGDLYVTGQENRSVYRFDARTGAYRGEFTTGFLLSSPQSMVFHPNGDLLVADFGTSQIVRFDGATGAYIGRFDTGGEYENPIDMAWGPDSELYVASATGYRVLKFSGATGEYLGDAVPGVLYDRPQAIAFSPQGDLYVATWGQSILQYDRLTQRLKNLISLPGQSNFVDLSFGLDGNVFVADYNFGVREFDGETGAYLGLAASLGSETTSFVIAPGSIPAVGVLANDRDVERSPLAVNVVTAPRFGQLEMSPDGTFRYTPNAGFQGEDSFSYRVGDGTASSDIARARIVVGEASVRVPGDANRDGRVDLTDLNLVRNNFGSAGPGILGDTNDDDIVDLVDLNLVRNNFGATAARGLLLASDEWHDAPVDTWSGREVRERELDLTLIDAALEHFGDNPLLRKRDRFRPRYLSR